jgi:hypothetical protein
MLKAFFSQNEWENWNFHIHDQMKDNTAKAPSKYPTQHMTTLKFDQISTCMYRTVQGSK